MNEYLIKDRGCQTLCWYKNDSYPAQYGNDIRYGNRSCTNLNAENLDYLLEKGIVEFPIKAEIINEYNLKVVDERVPKAFLIEKEEENFQQYKVLKDNGNGEVLIGYKGKVVDTEPIVYCPYIPTVRNPT